MPVETTEHRGADELHKYYEVYETIGSGNDNIGLCYELECSFIVMSSRLCVVNFVFLSRRLCQSQAGSTHPDRREGCH